MSRVEQILWRKVTNADFFNVERGPAAGPTSGGGQLYFSISFGANLAPAQLGAFLGVVPPEAVGSTRPTQIIDVRTLEDPDEIAPLEFRARYKPPNPDDRYYIARQNRRRPNGQRHPAWTPERGFPAAPAAISGKDDPAVPNLSQLKILVLLADDRTFHAAFVNTARRPPALPAHAEILFRPNAQCPADGIVQADDDAVDLDTWRKAIAVSRSWSRDGRPTTPEIEDATDATAMAAGARASGQGFRRSWPERRAIEQRAMAVATEHLTEGGWAVRDVSSDHSYDLHCTKGTQTLRVEVKGTTGDGSAVLLTGNEVALARNELPETALLIVSNIELDPRGDDNPIATGGELRTLKPWDPDGPGELHPIAYRYLPQPE